MSENKAPVVVTKKDIDTVFIRWFTFAEVGLNFERMQALAFCNSMLPLLQKLYPDIEDLSAAMQRHLTMFNSSVAWGGLINGITIALEEEISKGNEDAEQTKTLVQSLKTGLMGPLAGIGDTIDMATVRTIIVGLCVPFAIEGSVIAALMPLLVFGAYLFINTRNFIHLGYKRGRDSIVAVLKSGTIHKLINSASMFGLMMMGALSASYVKVSTPLVITSEAGTKIVVQEMINKLAPSLLSFAVVIAIYFYIAKKGPKFIRILVVIIILSMIFSYFGIL